MEEKTVGLLILGIVVLIAIVGMVMLFKEANTGAPVTVGQVATTCQSGEYRTSPEMALELQQSASADCTKMGPLYCCKPKPK